MSSKYLTDINKPHLGGNGLNADKNTWSPSSWKYVIEKYHIKNITDLGSGRGFISKWLADLGLNVTAVDGLEDNVKNAVISTIQHDLTEKAFVKNTDLVICLEVVEHIDEKYLDYLLDSMCQGKYLFMTHAVPGQKGYHHVNCQNSDYWINHLSKKSYTLLEEDSVIIRNLADRDKARHISRNGMLFSKN